MGTITGRRVHLSIVKVLPGMTRVRDHLTYAFVLRERRKIMSYSQNSLEGGYMGDYIRVYCRVLLGGY